MLIKKWIKRTMFWMKYGPGITTQTKINNLYYLIAPTFRNINRLFALSLKKGVIDPTRYSLKNITCHKRKSKILMH